MRIPLSTIVDAYEQTSEEYDYSVFINRTSGEIISTQLEDSWIDDETEEEMDAESLFQSEEWVEVPNKYDLNLGGRLVDDFCRSLMPEHQRMIQGFPKRGFYSSFKGFLASIDELENWFEFEKSRTRIALTDWCESKEIELVE